MVINNGKLPDLANGKGKEITLPEPDIAPARLRQDGDLLHSTFHLPPFVRAGQTISWEGLVSTQLQPATQTQASNVPELLCSHLIRLMSAPAAGVLWLSGWQIPSVELQLPQIPGVYLLCAVDDFPTPRCIRWTQYRRQTEPLVSPLVPPFAFLSNLHFRFERSVQGASKRPRGWGF